MTIIKIRRDLAEAYELVERGHAAINSYYEGTPDLDEDTVLAGSRLTSALRRTSHELSVALVDLRRPESAAVDQTDDDPVLDELVPDPVATAPRAARAGTRPTEITCACGALVMVASHGKVPTTCRACRPSRAKVPA